MSTLLAQVAEPLSHSTATRRSCFCECGSPMHYLAKRCRPCLLTYTKSPIDPQVYVVDGIMCRRLPLRKPYYAIVNSEKYDALSKTLWALLKNHDGTDFYAQFVSYNSDRTQTSRLMHRHIFGDPGIGMYVDHRNGFRLHNVIENLRAATPRQNQANRRMSRNNTSGYIGVFLDKRRGIWRSEVKDGTVIHRCGYFVDRVEAAKARDAKSLEIFGEFAVLNFPTHDPTPEMTVLYPYLSGIAESLGRPVDSAARNMLLAMGLAESHFS